MASDRYLKTCYPTGPSPAKWGKKLAGPDRHHQTNLEQLYTGPGHWSNVKQAGPKLEKTLLNSEKTRPEPAAGPGPA